MCKHNLYLYISSFLYFVHTFCTMYRFFARRTDFFARCTDFHTKKPLIIVSFRLYNKRLSIINYNYDRTDCNKGRILVTKETVQFTIQPRDVPEDISRQSVAILPWNRLVPSSVLHYTVIQKSEYSSQDQ